ncbi:MAG: hypothetical protein WC897_00085 [Candidatus Gracilibacteria bacterium]
MKKSLFALVGLAITTLILTGCGKADLSQVDGETLDTHPRLQEVADTWETMKESAINKDCTTLLSYMRSSLNLTEESCTVAYEYFAEAPEVDWARTDWSTEDGKAKIYQTDRGSITSFIYDGRYKIWRADSEFWAE